MVGVLGTTSLSWEVTLGLGLGGEVMDSRSLRPRSSDFSARLFGRSPVFFDRLSVDSGEFVGVSDLFAGADAGVDTVFSWDGGPGGDPGFCGPNSSTLTTEMLSIGDLLTVEKNLCTEGVAIMG